MQLLPQFHSSVSILIFLCFGLFNAKECNGLNFARTITVDKFGRGDFERIQDAIDSIPENNNQWIQIYARRGTYFEKVSIPYNKPFILLEGEGQQLTTISWGDHLITDISATFTSEANNFVAKGITFKNSYNPALYNEQTTLAEQKFVMAPAVAARTYGDKSSFHHCSFLGLQDTLFDVVGRHYFNSCYIEGAVDFIWGGGQSFYEDCTINVTAGLLPPSVYAGYITAQARKSSNDPSGFVFRRGTVFGSRHAYLGRAYGPYSRVIFHETALNMDVAPEGWYAWHNQGHEGDFTYSEVNCRGPGSDTSKRVKWVKWLSASELNQFTRSSFIDQDGWLARQP